MKINGPKLDGKLAKLKNVDIAKTETKYEIFKVGAQKTEKQGEGTDVQNRTVPGEATVAENFAGLEEFDPNENNAGYIKMLSTTSYQQTGISDADFERYRHLDGNTFDADDPALAGTC